MQNAARPDYISYFDPIVEYYIVDVIKYLPEKRRKELHEMEKEKKKNAITEESSLLMVSDEDRAFSLNKD